MTCLRIFQRKIANESIVLDHPTFKRYKSNIQVCTSSVEFSRASRGYEQVYVLKCIKIL